MILRRIQSVFAIAVLLLTLPPSPDVAAAQAPGDVDLVVTDLNGSLRPDEDLTVRLEIRNEGMTPAQELSLTVDVLSQTTSRSDLRRAMDSSVSRLRLGGAQRQLEPVAGGAVAAVELRLSAAEAGLAGADPGVYPLELALRGAQGVVGSVRTSVVLTGESIGEPVRLALVVPVTGPLGVLPDGRVRIDPLGGDLQDDGRLPALAATLADSPAVPLTLSIDALVLREAAAATDGYTAVDTAGVLEVPAGTPPAQRAEAFLDDVQAVLARRDTEQLALPYGAADLVALARAEQPATLAHAIRHGRSEAEAVTGQPVLQSALHPPLGLAAGVLDAASAAGIDTVLARPSDIVTDGASVLSPSPVQPLAVAAGTITSVVSDPELGETLAATPTSSGSDPGSAVRAQRFLSELAALYFERPFAQEVRGVAVVPPLLWNPDPVTVGRVFDLLAEASWVQPVTLTALVREVAPAGDRAAPRSDADADALPVGLLEDIAAARASLETLDHVLTGPDERLRAERLLWAAGSVHARSHEDAARELVDSVRRASARVLDSVEVVPGPQIILTGRREEIPVTVRNTGGLPLRVRVAGRSTAYAFPGGASSQPVTVPAGESRQVDLTVETLRPGATAPIDVTVTDAVGERILARGQVVVRSAATSPVALAITVSAGLFLAVWWMQDARRRRSGAGTTGGHQRSGAAGVHSPTPQG